MTSDFLVDFPGLGIYDLPVNREAFKLFNTLPVYWYGLLIAVAIILGLFLSMRQAGKFNLTADDIMDTFILMIPLMIIGARIYYVIFQWDYYKDDLTLIFNTRHGGLAFYGGVIGGILAMLIITRLKKKPASAILDFLVVYVPLGQAIGRWGNFFNQEAFGTNTNLPWGMYSNGTENYLSTLGSGFDATAPVHPTFLYEFIANLIIFAILLKIRKRNRTPYVTTLAYLAMYGFVRFFVEGIRTDALMIPGTSLRISMVLSALMVVGSVIGILLLNRRRQNLELIAALSDQGDDSLHDQAASDDSETVRTEEPSAEDRKTDVAVQGDDQLPSSSGTDQDDALSISAAGEARQPTTGKSDGTAPVAGAVPPAGDSDFIELDDQ